MGLIPEEKEEEKKEEINKMVAEPVRALAQHPTEDKGSSGSTTGSNVDGSSTLPKVSNVIFENLPQVRPEPALQLSLKNRPPKAPSPHQLMLRIDQLAPSLPAELSFGTMAALAETRHFDSDDSSEDETDRELDPDSQGNNRDASWKSIDTKLLPRKKSARNVSSFLPEQPRKMHQPSSALLSVVSDTTAASLMVQTIQFDRDDLIEDDVDAEHVTVVVPPGPLGLNLDGRELHRAVVLGFTKVRDGSKGPLERNGNIVHGSTVVRINGEDVSRASLNEVRIKLGELSQRSRTLVFRLPAQKQQECPRASCYPTMRRAPTLPPFEEDSDKRRKLELVLVMRYDKSVLSRHECWFFLDVEWMARWVHFVARGGPEPGPITNEMLLHQNWRKMRAHDTPGRPDTPRDGLVLLKNYRVVSPMVWCLLAELHGPGEAPLLARYLMNIYADALSDGEISVRIKVPRLEATVLVNDLLDKCLVRRSKTRRV